MEKPLIPYIRQSRTDEATVSFKDQWEAIERWAAANAAALSVGTLAEADAAGLVERNTSGNSYWRERELGQAITACQRGEAAGIVVYDQSRFTREKLFHTVEAWDALVEEAGAVLVSASGGGEVTELEYLLHGYMNRRQWVAARDRGNAARRRAVAEGKYVSARVPLGYRKEAQRLVPDPETVAVVVELFERRARGESWSALSRWIASVGRPMSRSGLKALIENEAYLGVARSGEYRNEQAHEALVGRALFDRAKAARGLRPVRTGALSSVAMLRSLCRCATCGGTMTVTWTRGAADPLTGERAKLACYACRGDSAKGRCEGRAYARADELDAHVEGRVLAAFAGEGPVAEAVASSEAVELTARALDDAEHVLRELLASTRLVATLGADEYATLIENAKAEEARARVEYAEARNRSEAVGGFEGDMLRAWPGLTPNEKRKVLAGFVDRVVVTPSHGRRRVPLASRVQIVLAGNVLLEPDNYVGVRGAQEIEPGRAGGDAHAVG
jgi:DNA invertase Pin-like site-specific DNA recombinase